LDDLLERLVGIAGPDGLALVALLHCGDLFLHIAVADLLLAVGVGDEGLELLDAVAIVSNAALNWP
jgi:hypothetical protein